MGDDAFVEVASWGAEKYWHVKNNRFLGRDKNLPNTMTEIKGFPFGLPKSYRFQSMMLLSATKYLISAGGSTLHSQLKNYDVKQLAVDRKKVGHNLKIGGIGVSVGPFKSLADEKAISGYLKSIDFLAVRDNASFEFVQSLNLPYKPINAFDLAALLPAIYGVPSVLANNNKKIIGVSVCPYESLIHKGDVKSEISRNKNITKLLRELCKDPKVHLKFIVVNGHSKVGDFELTKKTISEVQPKSYEIVPYNRSTSSMWNEIASCDFVIATRLHAAVFACFSNIPFMLNEYHKKCSDFIDDIAYHEGQRLFNDAFDPKEKARQILKMVYEKGVYQKPKNTEQMIEKARFNFTKVNL